MMKKIFSALLTIGSITAGAQAQSFEGQALQTTASPQGASALLPSETSTSEASDYALSFSEAAPRRHYQYRSTSASAYAGTLELGFVSADRNGRIEFLGSFGTLVSPTIYLGGGLGFDGYFSRPHRDAFWMLPLFVNLRATLPTSSVVKPFFDIKPGYSLGLTHSGLHGLYLSISGGIAINHFTMSLGYGYQEFNSSKYFDKYWGSSGGLSLKFGVLL